MPGGSPTFRTESDVERLYDHLEVLFTAAEDGFKAATLRQFHDDWTQQRVASRGACPSATSAK